MFSVLFVPFLLSSLTSPLLAQASTIAFTPEAATSSVAAVPFYSQFKDISSTKWQKVGCGIASLAMVVDYYATSSISVDKMLSQGIALGAYSNAGWTYQGLIDLAKKYKLAGKSYDFGKSDTQTAFVEFKKQLQNGPVIASVHYKFDPKSTIPHLVVIDGIEDGMIVYNDPAAHEGAKKISAATFLNAWKKRFIVITPPPAVAQAKAAVSVESSRISIE